MTVLATPRLRLRAPEVRDVDAITAACQDERVQRWVPIPVPYRREHAVAFVDVFVPEGWRTGERCGWVLEHEGGVVGTIGISGIGDGAGELGYWLASRARGRGLMREAAAAVLDLAFAAAPAGLGLDRVGWRAYAGNTASAALAADLGFRYEGTSRLGAVGRTGREDEWLAGLLATDPRSPTTWPVLEDQERRAR